jgi:hypothetical protein
MRGDFEAVVVGAWSVFIAASCGAATWVAVGVASAVPTRAGLRPAPTPMGARVVPVWPGAVPTRATHRVAPTTSGAGAFRGAIDRP